MFMGRSKNGYVTHVESAPAVSSESEEEDKGWVQDQFPSFCFTFESCTF